MRWPTRVTGQRPWSARGWTPELVVTDMMMPVMDGRELIRRLRADPATAHIPILSVTGNGELANTADAFRWVNWTWTC